MEFCPGGELLYHLRNIGRFTEGQARFYFCEIILGIEYLQSNNIFYRDLKPENVMLDFDGHIKLVNFGLSSENLRSGIRHTYCGSAEYMSPEMAGKRERGTVCFSLGSLVYEMLAGSPPFFDEDKDKMFQKMQNEALLFPSYFTAEVKDLISGLLSKDPETRYGSEFISDIKDHPWCVSVHWKKLYKKKINPPFRPNYRKSNFNSKFDFMEVDYYEFNEERYFPLVHSVERDNFYSSMPFGSKIGLELNKHKQRMEKLPNKTICYNKSQYEIYPLFRSKTEDHSIALPPEAETPIRQIKFSKMKVELKKLFKNSSEVNI